MWRYWGISSAYLGAQEFIGRRRGKEKAVEEALKQKPGSMDENQREKVATSRREEVQPEGEERVQLDAVSMRRMRSHLPNIGYDANPSDQTMAAYLHEAFKLLEIRFSIFDDDQAGMVIFSKMVRDLSKYGFVEEGRLASVYQKVDWDNSQTLDFMEFLCLMYYWQAQGGDLFSFFRTEQNIKMIKMAFAAMQKCVAKYDEV
jgi:hypothetical protein